MSLFSSTTCRLFYIARSHHYLRVYLFLYTPRILKTVCLINTPTTMSFVAIKLLKLGYSQAKKHKAKKHQEQQQQQQEQQRAFQHPSYTPQYPEQYPMSGYPPNASPGSKIHYPPPETAPAPEQSKTSTKARMILSALRLLQVILGLIVIGLYGVDVQHDHEANHIWRPKWIFALVVGFLATSTALMHLLVPCCLRRIKSAPVVLGANLPHAIWEAVLCVLWLTLFGVSAEMYRGVVPGSTGTGQGQGHAKRDPDPRGGGGGAGSAGLGDSFRIVRMQNAVIFDLANLGLWVLTASWGLVRWFRARRAARVAGTLKGDGV